MENLRVVLVGTRNPLNLGAVARAMSNFGAMHLRVVQPYERAFRSAVSAVGASAVLQEAEEFATVAEAVADCWMVVGTTSVGNREIQHPLRSLEVAGAVLRRGMTKGKVALLFGSEKWGLSNESLSHCHWLVRIPTREEHRSMNLGQAAAVCLYEIAKGKSGSEEKDGREKCGGADGDGGTDWGGAAARAGAERVYGRTEEGTGGGEVAKDAAADVDDGGGCGGFVGDGSEDWVVDGGEELKISN